jgi:outer membrane protein TolC
MQRITLMARTKTTLLVCVLLGPTGCTSSALRPDVAKVKQLARVPVLPKVPEGGVETMTPEAVHDLLKKPLSADGAVRIALLNNRDLRAALRMLGVSRGRLMQAGLIANPVFEVEVLPERDSDLELRVEYDVSSLVLAPLASQAAEVELQAERIEVAGEVVRLGFDVRRAFYAVQAAELSLSIAQRSLDALTAGRDAAEALLAAGNVPALEASRQIVAYETARIEVAQRELGVADARERMQRLLGLYGAEVEWQIAGAFPEIPESLALPPDIEARAIAASLDLRAIARRLEAASRRTGVARVTGYLPEVAVDVHALRVKQDDHHTDSGFRYGGGVSVGVPLFDRRQGTLRATEAQFDVLREQQQGLAIALRSHVREARNRLVAAHARVRAYEGTLVPAQRTVMEQTVRQYNAMQLGVFELLAARRGELQIELGHVAAQRAYFDALAALDAILAGKLPGGERTDAHEETMELGAPAQGGH